MQLSNPHSSKNLLLSLAHALASPLLYILDFLSNIPIISLAAQHLSKKIFNSSSSSLSQKLSLVLGPQPLWPELFSNHQLVPPFGHNYMIFQVPAYS